MEHMEANPCFFPGMPQNILVDGSWKSKWKGKQRQATIVWTTYEDPPSKSQETRIFAISALQREARAMLIAIQDLKWRCADLLIKTDSLEIITSLRNERSCNKVISSIIKEIRNIAKTFLCKMSLSTSFLSIMIMKEMEMNCFCTACKVWSPEFFSSFLANFQHLRCCFILVNGFASKILMHIIEWKRY